MGNSHTQKSQKLKIHLDLSIWNKEAQGLFALNEVPSQYIHRSFVFNESRVIYFDPNSNLYYFRANETYNNFSKSLKKIKFQLNLEGKNSSIMIVTDKTEHASFKNDL